MEPFLCVVSNWVIKRVYTILVWNTISGSSNIDNCFIFVLILTSISHIKGLSNSFSFIIYDFIQLTSLWIDLSLAVIYYFDTSALGRRHQSFDRVSNSYRNIVMDVMRMNKGHASQCLIIDEESNANAVKFFDLLKDSDEPLWDGCTNHSKLLVIEHVFTIMLNHGFHDAGYYRIIRWMRSILPERSRFKENLYVTKSMMKPFGLGY